MYDPSNRPSGALFRLNSNHEVGLIPGEYVTISSKGRTFTHQCGDKQVTHDILTYGYERDLPNNCWERYTAYAVICERTSKIFIVEGSPERYEGIMKDIIRPK